MEKEDKKFIWYGLRIGFLIMIGCWLLLVVVTIPEDTFADWLFLIVWVTSVIFTFVVAIVHLTKHKQKGLAITSLVLSSWLILMFLVGIILGATGYYDYTDYDSSENLTEQETQELIDYVDNFCSISCQGLKNVYTYDYTYNEELDEVFCYCLDENYDIILQKIIPFDE
jgi:predicted membrane protein